MGIWLKVWIVGETNSQDASAQISKATLSAVWKDSNFKPMLEKVVSLHIVSLGVTQLSSCTGAQLTL